MAKISTPDLLSGRFDQHLEYVHRLLREFGEQPHNAGRWIRRGITAPDGQRIYLEAIQHGSRMVSTRRAVREFLRARAAAAKNRAGRKEAANPD